MQDLSVTIIQTDLFWENPTANLANLEEKMAQISLPTDLIILPEMFTTGFTMNAKSIADFQMVEATSKTHSGSHYRQFYRKRRRTLL
jgi:predicted amidohydrolase